MKRIFLLCLVIITALTVLSSCGEEKNSSAPEGMKLFSGENVDYTAYVPKDWTIDMSTGTLSAYVSSVDASNITISAYILDNAAQTPEEYWKEHEADFKSTFGDMKYEKEGSDTTLDGLAAKEYVYTATVTGIDYKFRQIVAINAGKVYIITYTSTPEKYDDNLENIDKVINSFKFN